MKKVLLVLLFGVALTSFSQTPLNLEYKRLYNNPIIIPTWNNLTKLLFADMRVFRATMDDYSYSLATDGSGYIADTQIGSPYFVIKKTNRDITMIFTEDDGFVSSFRRELRSYLGNVQAKYADDFEFYYVIYTHDNSKYKIRVGLNERINGNGAIFLTFE